MAYSIKDLEHLSGIKAHTLRIWEQRYGILKPERTDTNIRLYNDADLKLVLNISLLNENGYKISRIAGMNPEEIHREVITITEKAYKYPEQVQALTLSMIDLDEDRFEKILSTNVLHFGFERCMINVVFPFMMRIGFLWQTGAINPAQEHFMSNLIRQKLIVAIDGLMPRYEAGRPRFMLFLPEGEMHEVSLLFCNYLLRSRHFRTLYLGQNLPFSDAAYVYDHQQPEYVVCIITSYPGQNEIQAYLDAMGRTFEKSQILLSGYQVVGQDLRLSPNMTVLPNIERMIDTLEEIAMPQAV